MEEVGSFAKLVQYKGLLSPLHDAVTCADDDDQDFFISVISQVFLNLFVSFGDFSCFRVPQPEYVLYFETVRNESLFNPHAVI